ncbi:hypothetical protein [Yimella lutea]|uniref:hypothetical protein n=1 Tax=Yimella lutea TaxID=587872 RepID=UPI0011543AA0
MDVGELVSLTVGLEVSELVGLEVSGPEVSVLATVLDSVLDSELLVGSAVPVVVAPEFVALLTVTPESEPQPASSVVAATALRRA